MKKNKILIILNDLKNGGVERVLSVLANYFADRGYAVNILAIASDQISYPLSPKVKYEYVPIIGIYKRVSIFKEFDVMNRNERIYTSEKFIPCLEELNTRMASLGVVYGEFDHPDVFDTSLSRASHTIRSASYVKEHNRVDGEIRLLSTYWGKEAKSLVNDGCPLFVS